MNILLRKSLYNHNIYPQILIKIRIFYLRRNFHPPPSVIIKQNDIVLRTKVIPRQEKERNFHQIKTYFPFGR